MTNTVRIGKLGFVALVFVHLCISLIRIITTTAPDFSVFYYSAYRIVHGLPIYGDTGLFTALGYPPATLLLFVPFLLLPYQGAQAIFILVSLLCLFLSIGYIHALLGKHVSVLDQCVWFCLAFLSFPTKFTLGMGQVNLVAVFLLVVVLFLIQKKNVSLAGIVFGVLLLVKPHLVLVIPAFVITGYAHILVGTIGFLVIAYTTSGVIWGGEVYQEYISRVVPPLAVYAGREIYYNQGIGAFFARLLPQQIAYLWTMGMSALIYLASCLVIGNKKPTLLVSVVLFSIVFLLVEPLSWQHHYVFLLSAFLVCWHKAPGVLWRVMVGISYVLVSINIKEPAKVAGSLLSPVMLSHVLWGNIVLLSITLKLIRQSKQAL